LPFAAASRRLALAAILLAAAGSAGRADSAAESRGAYLAAAAGCDQCHTDSAHGGQPYAGGRRLATAFGTIPTPNITPDAATGIGDWSVADFARALRWGVAPDDSHYVPAFPFPFYQRLGDRDLADLKAFLDSLPAVSTPRAVGADSKALLARAGAAMAIALEPPHGKWRPDTTRDAVWNRGGYLVATVGRCGDCHTPRDLAGRPIPDRFLAGNASNAGGKKAPNITPDRETGIGKWSEDEIIALLKDGQTPEVDFVGGAMAEIVRNTTRLTDADRWAIAVYLLSIPAKSFPPKN